MDPAPHTNNLLIMIQMDRIPSEKASTESSVEAVNASSNTEKPSETLASANGSTEKSNTQEPVEDSAVSEQEAVEAETLASSRDDCSATVEQEQ